MKLKNRWLLHRSKILQEYSNSPVCDRVLSFNDSRRYHDHVSFDPFQWLSIHDCRSPETTTYETWYSIHGPWIVDGVDLHSCFILEYMNALSHFTVDWSRFLESLLSRIMLYAWSDLSVLLVSIVSIHSWQVANHAVGNEQKKRLLCHLHPTSSAKMNNAQCSIHHLASSNISSPREVAPLSPREISASVSLLNSVWWNLRIPLCWNLYFCPKVSLPWADWVSTATSGKFSLSKLSINHSTWTTHRSAQRYKEEGF